MSDCLIVGATGLVGAAVLTSSGDPMVALTRRAPDPPLAARHRLIVADSADWPAQIAQLRPTVLINCLGTTIRQAGSQAAFRAVDHDLVLATAHAAYAGGARHMITVSSVGARANSGNFYLRTKGAVEEELADIGFDRLDILRPGLLLGDRSGPPRLGEAIGRLIAPLSNALTPAAFDHYRGIAAARVAAAIIALSGRSEPGRFVHHNRDMLALASNAARAD